MSVTVGIDIGGTSVLAVAFDGGRTPVTQVEVPTDARGGKSIVESVVRAWFALPSDLGATRAGVGVPGRVDPRSGRVRLAVNLGIGEEPYPLGAEIEAAIGMPVAIENDVKAAALGLHDDLAHQGEATSSLALLNIGTGIAAGVVVDGSIFRGANGMAGEIGHVIIDEGGIDCRCGQRGCLETVAAGPAISREWAGGAESLFSAATNGDRRAQHVAQSVGGYLARAITWLAATFDIDQVYLGGGVTRAGKPFLDAVRQKLMDYAENSRLAAQRLDPERVLLAPGNGFLGPRGAAVLADRALRSLAWKE